jgi:hypothetical protein
MTKTEKLDKETWNTVGLAEIVLLGSPNYDIGDD